jgi:hypothetical protein
LGEGITTFAYAIALGAQRSLLRKILESVTIRASINHGCGIHDDKISIWSFYGKVSGCPVSRIPAWQDAPPGRESGRFHRGAGFCLLRSGMVRRLIHFLLALASLASFAARAEDIVVVVNAGSGVESLSRDDVINIFLGGLRRLSPEVAAQPVDLPRGDPMREEFYRRLVGKTLPEINAHWSRLVWSEKTRPPVQAGSVEGAQAMAAESADVITYLERGKVDGRLKTVFVLLP